MVTSVWVKSLQGGVSPVQETLLPPGRVSGLGHAGLHPPTGKAEQCPCVLCELGVLCFLLKGINKWFFEANGLFCLCMYAIIPLQSCNNLPDVRLALYTFTLMSYRVLTPCPAHTLFPLLLWIIFLSLACCLPAVMGVCPFAHWESGSKSYVCFFSFYILEQLLWLVWSRIKDL